MSKSEDQEPSGVKRTLTIEVDITQPEADWIWESHMQSKHIHGCWVRVIAEGALQEQIDSAMPEVEDA